MTASTTTASVAHEFDAKAPTYESNRLSGWYTAQSAMVLDLLHAGPTGVVLDVGCGTGWFLRHFLKRHPEAVGVGIDLSAGMIDVARRRAEIQGITNAVFAQGDWNSPGIVKQVRRLTGDSAVDVVVCTSAFHYFDDPATAIGRMRECLVPGGELIIIERARRGSMLTTVWDWAHRHLIRDHVRFHDEDNLIPLLRRTGFDRARIHARFRRYFWRRKLYTSIAIIRAENAPTAVARPVAAEPRPHHQPTLETRRSTR